MNKRIVHLSISLVLAFMMILSLAGCGSAQQSSSAASSTVSTSVEASSESAEAQKNYDPFGKSDTPVTVTAILNYSPAGDPTTLQGVTPETQSFVKLAKDKLNIDIKYLWQAPSDQYDTRFSVALSSNDLPDVMSVKSQQYEILRQNDQLADLTDAYNYLSPMMKSFVERDPNAISLGKSDGKLYGIPQYWDPRRDVQEMFIRKDWLDELGLSVPKTMDELKNVAKAFVDKKKAVGGFAMCKVFDGWGFDIKTYMYPFNSYPKKWIVGSDGSIVAGETQPETKVALQYLSEFYKDGIIDKEFATKNEDKMAEELTSGKLGIAIGTWWMYEWPLNNSKDKDPKANWVVSDLPSFDGAPVKTLINRFTIDGTNSFKVINKNCKNPEAVIKLFNLYIDICNDIPKYGDAALPKGGFVWSWCPTQYNDPYDINSAFEHVNAAIDANDQGANLNSSDKVLYDKYVKYKDYLAGNTPWDGSQMGNAMARIAKDGGWGLTRDIVEKNTKVYNEFFGTLTPSMIDKGATLDKLTEETFIKIIMGAAPVTEFDNYLSQWKQLGGDAITKEVNDWYTKNKQ